MLSEAKIAELKEKHGEIYLLTAKGETVAVKSPGDGEWAAFLDDREKRGARAFKGLVRSCTLYPNENELQKLLDRLPGLANVFGAKLVELAGLDEEATVKKA